MRFFACTASTIASMLVCSSLFAQAPAAPAAPAGADYTTLPPEPIETQKQLEAAKVSMMQAVETAEKAMSGQSLAGRAITKDGVVTSYEVIVTCNGLQKRVLVDAVNGLATLQAQAEAVKQIAVADRIVLSKRDLVDTVERQADLEKLLDEIKSLAPGAARLEQADATASHLFGHGLYDAATKPEAVQKWLNVHGHHHHHHHHDVNRHGRDIRAFTAVTDAAMKPSALSLFIELMTSYHGAKILRLKGLVKLQDDPSRPLVIHGVQHIIHVPERLAAWPDADHRSRLVVITRGVEREEIQGLLDAFTDPLTGEGVAMFDDTLKI